MATNSKIVIETCLNKINFSEKKNFLTPIFFPLCTYLIFTFDVVPNLNKSKGLWILSFKDFMDNLNLKMQNTVPHIIGSPRWQIVTSVSLDKNYLGTICSWHSIDEFGFLIFAYIHRQFLRANWALECSFQN